VTHGQKTFNGVALLSKYPLEEASRGWPETRRNVHARFLEGVVSLNQAWSGSPASICHGNPVGTTNIPTIKWMSRLLEYSKQRLKTEDPGARGRFHVIPAARMSTIQRPGSTILFKAETRESLRSARPATLS